MGLPAYCLGRGLPIGRTWFDSAGQPHAVIPAPSYHGCLVIRFDLETGAPLAVRSFPSLEVVLSVDPPSTEDHCYWDFTACFVGVGLIINKLIGHDERLAAVDLNGEVHDLGEVVEGWPVPAAYGPWLTISRTAIRRCKLTQQHELW